MLRVGLDIETYNTAGLGPGDVGADAYAAHPATGVHCAVLKIDRDGEPSYRWYPKLALPAWFRHEVRHGAVTVVAHNASFERAIIRHILHPLLGWPTVPVSCWIDTLDFAAAAALPLSLEMLAATIGSPIQKDMEGAALMKAAARTATLAPAELERLLDYCETDVAAMLASLKRLPKPTPTEIEVQRVNRRINTRGVCIDQQLAAAMQRMVREQREVLDSRVAEVSRYDMMSTVSTPALKRWLKQRGVDVPVRRRVEDGIVEHVETTDRDAIETDLLQRENLPDDVRAVLGVRLESGKLTSLAKLARVEPMLNAQGKLLDSLRYCGAHTGRWSSTGPQFHNLPKNKLRDLTEPLRQAVLRGDRAALERSPASVLATLSQLLRSIVVATPGHELIGGDYSAIEARGIAWLAGQDDVLGLFRRGVDVYMHDAKRVHSDNRDFGKVQRLSLGYGMGGVRAHEQFRAAGIELLPKEAKKVVATWRAGNHLIVQFWDDLETAAQESANNPEKVFQVGEHLTLQTSRGCLRIKLPSGRVLHYWRPSLTTRARVIKVIDEKGLIVEREISRVELVFWTPGKRGMQREHTYGGKLAENVTQALCRDLLAEALLRLDSTSYDVILHVHDSIATEVPVGTGSVDEFCAIMAAVPSWAPGFPIAVEGYRNNYFKG